MGRRRVDIVEEFVEESLGRRMSTESLIEVTKKSQNEHRRSI